LIGLLGDNAANNVSFSQVMETFSDPEFLSYISGNAVIPGIKPWAHCYSGHQFGDFAGQLGDGRAISLGQVENDGVIQELQLKGAGRTPYSRFGDGRAVLRSSIREFIASEFMHNLNIPTTRALSLVVSDDLVRREKIERAAVVCRVSPSWVRFGSFEHHYHLNNPSITQRLADYVIKHHYSPLLALEAGEKRYAGFFFEVVKRTAEMIAHWQAIGFEHGVMNTDNISILGLTIDYGPFGFLDRYDPYWICNHSDYEGRYRFNLQPEVGLWNLQKLGEALSTLINAEDIRAALAHYKSIYSKSYLNLMRKKLGFAKEREDDLYIANEFLSFLQMGNCDYTNSFRALCSFNLEESSNFWIEFEQTPELRKKWNEWISIYAKRLSWEDSEKQSRENLMKSHNPKYIPRNYILQQLIEAAESGNFGPINEYMWVVNHPYEELHPNFHRFTMPPPPSAVGIQLSCSS